MLWGPVGVGKSALLDVLVSMQVKHIEVVRLDLRCFAVGDGSTRLGQTAGLAALMCTALGASGLDGRDPIEVLVSALEGRGRCLVVLDAAESCSDALQDILAHLTESAPSARFLVACQHLLGRCGGYTHRLDPLSLEDSTTLFAARAEAAAPGTQVNRDDPVLLEFLRCLDGIPLAIELAAARAGVLGAQGLLERVGDPLALLVDPSDRGRSLREAMARAWALLNNIERDVLAQLSIFEGGVRFAIAEVVVDAKSEPSLDVIQALVAKSLIASRQPTDLAMRQLSLLAGVRAFAAEHLATKTAELSALEERYRATFEILGRDLQRTVWRGEHQARVGFHCDYLSLVGAVDAGLTAKRPWAVRVLGEAFDLFRQFSSRDILYRLLHEGVGVPDAEARDLARVRFALTELAFADGRLEVASDWLDGVPLPDPRTDSPEVVARFALAQAMVHGHSLDEGQRCVRAALAAIPIDYASDEAIHLRLVALSRLAISVSAGGSFDEVEAIYGEALALAVKTSHRSAEMLLLNNYGAWLALEGKRQQAIVCSEGALVLAEMFGDHMIEATCALNLGESHLVFEQDVAAQGYFERARTIAQTRRLDRLNGIATGYLAAVHHVNGRLDDADSDYADAHGILSPSERDALSAALLDMCMGSLDCELGRWKRAAARFAVAEGFFVASGEAALQRAVAIQSTLLGLHRDTADVVKDRATALWHEASPPRNSPHPYRQQHVEFAYRLVVSAIGRHGAWSAARPALVVEANGSWFIAQGETRVSLGRRQAPRRILAFMAESACVAPERASSTAELFEIGWPKEAINPIHAANRLYFAIATLRQLGLGDIIQHVGDGYRIDPQIQVILK